MKKNIRINHFPVEIIAYYTNSNLIMESSYPKIREDLIRFSKFVTPEWPELLIITEMRVSRLLKELQNKFPLIISLENNYKDTWLKLLKEAYGPVIEVTKIIYPEELKQTLRFRTIEEITGSLKNIMDSFINSSEIQKLIKEDIV